MLPLDRQRHYGVNMCVSDAVGLFTDGVTGPTRGTGVGKKRGSMTWNRLALGIFEDFDGERVKTVGVGLGNTCGVYIPLPVVGELKPAVGIARGAVAVGAGNSCGGFIAFRVAPPPSGSSTGPGVDVVGVCIVVVGEALLAVGIDAPPPPPFANEAWARPMAETMATHPNKRVVVRDIGVSPFFHPGPSGLWILNELSCVMFPQCAETLFNVTRHYPPSRALHHLHRMIIFDLMDTNLPTKQRESAHLI